MLNDVAVSFGVARHGMPRIEIIVVLSAPTRQLTADVWIYTDCKLIEDPEDRRIYGGPGPAKIIGLGGG